MIELSFSIDFTGSEDIAIENNPDSMIVESIVQAECSETVASVKEYPHSKLVWKVSWRKLDPPQERALTYQARLNAPLKSLIERTSSTTGKKTQPRSHWLYS